MLCILNSILRTTHQLKIRYQWLRFLHTLHWILWIKRSTCKPLKCQSYRFGLDTNDWTLIFTEYCNWKDPHVNHWNVGVICFFNSVNTVWRCPSTWCWAINRDYDIAMKLGTFFKHWGRDKMATIFQMTFLNPFSLMKIYEFWLRFHWSLFMSN